MTTNKVKLNKRVLKINKRRELLDGIIPEHLKSSNRQQRTLMGLAPSILDNYNKQQEMLGGAVSKLMEGYNGQQRTLMGLAPSILDNYNKQQEMLGGAVSKLMEGYNGQQRTLMGLAPSILDNYNKLNINSNSNLFRNIIVSQNDISNFSKKQIISKNEVNILLNGLSPKKFRLKNEILGDKFESVLVNTKTNESIPTEILPSTIGVTDLLKDITKDEVLSFYHHLTIYPMLGLEHKIGIKILNEIEKYEFKEVNGINMFRGRPRNKDEREIPYSPEEMLSAPFGVSQQGRYNIVGQGELYVCSDKDVAIQECTKGNNMSVDVIEWKLVEKVKLIDLTERDCPLIKFCNFSVQTSKNLEYLVPNFISQCAKMKGLTGFVFTSAIDKNALNFVFFDYLDRWFRFVKIEEIGA
jgi:hypothetical protein